MSDLAYKLTSSLIVKLRRTCGNKCAPTVCFRNLELTRGVEKAYKKLTGQKFGRGIENEIFQGGSG